MSKCMWHIICHIFWLCWKLQTCYFESSILCNKWLERRRGFGLINDACKWLGLQSAHPLPFFILKNGPPVSPFPLLFIPQSTYRGGVEIGGVYALSAGAYTIVYVMVDIVKGGAQCTHHSHQPRQIFPSWWNIRQKVTIATLCVLCCSYIYIRK